MVLKAYKVAIDSRRWFCQTKRSNQKSRRSNWQGTEAIARSRRRCARHFSTAAAAPASWARGFPRPPSPGAYKYPLGGSSGRYQSL